MADDFEIEDGIPIPPRYGGSQWITRLRKLNVGQSTFFAGVAVRRISGSVAHAQKMLPGVKFTTRTAKKDGVTGVRIWRTA